MTDQCKDEIWVEFDSQGEGYVNFEEVDNSVHYVRKDLSPPLPDDVAEAIKLIRNATACNRGCGLEYYADEIGIIIRAASKPPVDTIPVPREVLQGVRLSLCIAKRDFKNWLSNEAARDAAIESVDKGIASLDAVLSEGE
jgi:hypothetical protein